VAGLVVLIMADFLLYSFLVATLENGGGERKGEAG
jgi:hypothetical protein